MRVLFIFHFSPLFFNGIIYIFTAFSSRSQCVLLFLCIFFNFLIPFDGTYYFKTKSVNGTTLFFAISCMTFCLITLQKIYFYYNISSFYCLFFKRAKKGIKIREEKRTKYNKNFHFKNVRVNYLLCRQSRILGTWISK